MAIEESFSYVMSEPAHDGDNWECEIMFNRREWSDSPCDYDFIVGMGSGDDEILAFRDAYRDMLMWLNRVHVKANDCWRASVAEIMFTPREAR